MLKVSTGFKISLAINFNFFPKRKVINCQKKIHLLERFHSYRSLFLDARTCICLLNRLLTEVILSMQGRI